MKHALLSIVGIGLLSSCALMGSAEETAKRETVLFVPCHPDDIVSSVGTILLMRDKFDVHVCDFTHGERGLGKEKFLSGEAKAIRTREEETVCRDIGATLHWLDEVDGSAYASKETCEKLAALITELKPRAVFGHWPIERHADHLMASAALQKAVKLAGFTGEFYFFEESYDSKGFQAVYYVDITRVAEEKHRIINQYVSQNRNDFMVSSEMNNNLYRGERARDHKFRRSCEAFAPYIGSLQGSRIIFSEIGF